MIKITNINTGQAGLIGFCQDFGKQHNNKYSNLNEFLIAIINPLFNLDHLEFELEFTDDSNENKYILVINKHRANKANRITLQQEIEYDVYEPVIDIAKANESKEWTDYVKGWIDLAALFIDRALSFKQTKSQESKMDMLIEKIESFELDQQQRQVQFEMQMQEFKKIKNDLVDLVDATKVKKEIKEAKVNDPKSLIEFE